MTDLKTEWKICTGSCNGSIRTQVCPVCQCGGDFQKVVYNAFKKPIGFDSGDYDYRDFVVEHDDIFNWQPNPFERPCVSGTTVLAIITLAIAAIIAKIIF